VLIQVVCHAILNSREIAEVVGVPHERVAAALRNLKGSDRFQLTERDGSLDVVPGTLASDLRQRINSICRDEWPAE